MSVAGRAVPEARALTAMQANRFIDEEYVGFSHGISEMVARALDMGRKRAHIGPCQIPFSKHFKPELSLC